ncbi:PASTA domain-containing protein [Solirubrobacter sp. CPCC 204708]|uniref:PASTA domain-containing protein n=1 Tax=Solirubrobacter deserti TaxID=2282478 RepID=A0ABT4RIX8_9ACTN|nr:PASTA domain-containing protein [Solirubrobacter deserti]MBE2320883.1 PASTA domain-containing protein [Solirubrobacter deserti]MDA0138518.1 PASTA domain-containing protein [Solirubrobacter deserti]
MHDTRISSPAVGELECPKCGTVAVNRDFCACGEYLGWELTFGDGEEPVAAPATYRAPAPAEPRRATLLTLRDPARQDDPNAAVAVGVVPGGHVSVLATVRNQGEIVDTYDLRVDGLPEGWATISAPTVFLNPWGSAGDFQRELQITLHPPRVSASEARAWPVMVVARSRSLGTDVAWAPATLHVAPFEATAMRVGPERRRGRRHAAFDVAVTNHGNSPLEITIGARDTEARCPVTVYPERVLIPVGATAAGIVRVHVPRPLLCGRPVDHHIDVTHRASGADADPVPQRVTFRQRPWLPWWVPPAVALVAAFALVLVLLQRDTDVPKLTGDTRAEAHVILEKHGLQLGRTRYATGPKDVPLGTVIAQQPAGGAEMERGEEVHITLAAPPEKAAVPPVNGMPLARAADALTDAGFVYDPQPSSAGNDWVVIRQDPTPGTKREVGTKVTLAVEDRTPQATPTPVPTVPAAPAPQAEPSPAPDAGAAKTKAGSARKAEAKVKAAASAALPASLVFAGSTSGQLYRSTGARTTRLTAAKYRLETPTKTDDGYAAVHVEDGARRLVRISSDGKTVEPLVHGRIHRPHYSAHRGLLAFVARDAKRGPADAGRLCVLDPQDAGEPTCARGRPVGRPVWSPDGRSVLALGGRYHELVVYTARGGDAQRWRKPVSAYRAAHIQSAAWVGDDRVAVLVADRPGAPAHVRLLARAADGRFTVLKDFPRLTGFELAAHGHRLALRRGTRAADDGKVDLLDLKRERPRVRTLAHGVNPAF